MATKGKEWLGIFEETSESAREAWKAVRPEAMIVENGQTGQRWTVEEGICGFSYLIVRDARSGFVRWLREQKIGHKHYGGGWAIPSWHLVPEDRRSQSYDRKDAATKAGAEILLAHGIEAFAESRLD